jgi:nitrogen regulatory protein PII-like uncharacterized protein
MLIRKRLLRATEIEILVGTNGITGFWFSEYKIMERKNSENCFFNRNESGEAVTSKWSTFIHSL